MREVAKVPLIFQSPPDKGDLGGWGFRDPVVPLGECFFNN